MARGKDWRLCLQWGRQNYICSRYGMVGACRQCSGSKVWERKTWLRQAGQGTVCFECSRKYNYGDNHYHRRQCWAIKRYSSCHKLNCVWPKWSCSHSPGHFQCRQHQRSGNLIAKRRRGTWYRLQRWQLQQKGDSSRLQSMSRYKLRELSTDQLLLWGRLARSRVKDFARC